MVRYRLMSKLGLVEPLVRWQRSVERGRPGPVPPSPAPAERTRPRLAVRPR